MGVGQRSALSSVLSTLYLFSLLHIFEKWLKNLKIPVSILFFENNRLFITQNKSMVVSNLNLFCSYHIIISLLEKFSLVIEHRKTKVFHFSRSYSIFDPLPLNLTILGDLTL